MLQLTASALMKYGTRRCHAIRTLLLNMQQFAEAESLFHLYDLNLNNLAWKCTVHKMGKPIDPASPCSFVTDPIDLDRHRIVFCYRYFPLLRIVSLDAHVNSPNCNTF